MLRFAALILSVASFPLAAAAPVAPGLDGTWVVDLSTEPDKPYVKDMALTLNEDGTVSGSFYDSTIEAGQWKAARGRTCVSFRTSDGVGPYHTAACVDGSGSNVTGQTWAEHGNFLFNWNATRKVSAE